MKSDGCKDKTEHSYLHIICHYKNHVIGKLGKYLVKYVRIPCKLLAGFTREIYAFNVECCCTELLDTLPASGINDPELATLYSAWGVKKESHRNQHAEQVAPKLASKKHQEG